MSGSGFAVGTGVADAWSTAGVPVAPAPPGSFDPMPRSIGPTKNSPTAARRTAVAATPSRDGTPIEPSPTRVRSDG